MKIRFEDIPAEGLRLQITDAAWFPDHDLERRGPASADIFLERRGPRVFCRGEIRATIVLACDRCLEPYDFHVAEAFSADLEVAERRLPKNDIIECDSEGMDTIYLERPEVEIYELLAQQVYLSLPLKRLCREKCSGLCPKCGLPRQKDGWCCPEQGKESPFAVLKRLKEE